MKIIMDRDGGVLTIIVSDDLKIEANMNELFSEMDKDDRIGFAKAICWGEVLAEAAGRLLGSVQNWSSRDDYERLAFIQSVEAHLLSGYKWELFNEVSQLANNLITHEHIYWKLYHHHGSIGDVNQWLKDNGFTSNYTDKSPKFEEFKAMVEKLLNDAAAGIKANIPGRVDIDEEESKIERHDD